MNFLIYVAYAAPFVILGFLAFCAYRKVFGEKDYDAAEFEKATAMQPNPVKPPKTQYMSIWGAR